MGRYLVICAICLFCLGFFWGPSLAKGVDPLMCTVIQDAIQESVRNLSPMPHNSWLLNLSSVPGGNLSLNGSNFNDLNGDGMREKNEPGLSGWTIILKLSFLQKSGTRELYVGRKQDRRMESNLPGWGRLRH